MQVANRKLLKKNVLKNQNARDSRKFAIFVSESACEGNDQGASEHGLTGRRKSRCQARMQRWHLAPLLSPEELRAGSRATAQLKDLFCRLVPP